MTRVEARLEKHSGICLKTVSWNHFQRLKKFMNRLVQGFKLKTENERQKTLQYCGIQLEFLEMILRIRSERQRATGNDIFHVTVKDIEGSSYSSKILSQT